MGCLWQLQLRRQKHKDAAASGDSSEMTSPSPASCDLHELTSSPTSLPTSSDSEDDLPRGVDEDLLSRPSTYRLPGHAAVTGMPSPPPAAAPCYVPVNGMLSSSSEDEDEDDEQILSASDDDQSTAADDNV